MADNILETAQNVIQDVIAPDVRELKVRVAGLEKQADSNKAALEGLIASSEKHLDSKITALEKQMDSRITSLEKQMEARFSQMEANFKAVLSAIGEIKAKSDLESYKMFAGLQDRVKALELRLPTH